MPRVNLHISPGLVWDLTLRCHKSEGFVERVPTPGWGLGVVDGRWNGKKAAGACATYRVDFWRKNAPLRV